jgi:hypothetical protein
MDNKDTTPKQEKAPKEDFSFVSSLIERLEKLEQKNKELEGVLNSNNIVDPTVKKDLGNPIFKVSFYADKLIKSWKLTDNISYVMGNKYICEQNIELTFYTGDSLRLPYQEFVKNIIRTPMRAKQVISDGQNKTFVFEHEGRDYEISSVFA